MEIIWRVISWEVKQREQGKRQRDKEIQIGRYRIEGVVKNNIGNGVAKRFICISYGHELRGEITGGNGGVLGEGGQRGENQDNCNSIIDYMYMYIFLWVGSSLIDKGTCIQCLSQTLQDEYISAFIQQGFKSLYRNLNCVQSHTQSRQPQ